MKCPKCQYISFDDGNRCRNCGYEFLLAVEAQADDLGVQPPPEGPLADLELGHASGPQPGDLARAGTSRAERGTSQSTRWAELPLFPGDRPRDRPSRSSTGSPRPPLSVRRPTPPVPRLRERVAESRDGLASPANVETPGPSEAPAYVPAPGEGDVPPADLASRALAGLIDLVILGGVDVAVLHFTLQLSGLTWSNLGLLPWVPFVAFLLMVNGGYLVAFTATVGQTVGKMASGIRIADAAPRGGLPPTLQQAVVRAASMVISIVPLGLGLLPVLLASDRRALHDRLAGTRVIHAG